MAVRQVIPPTGQVPEASTVPSVEEDEQVCGECGHVIGRWASPSDRCVRCYDFGPAHRRDHLCPDCVVDLQARVGTPL